MAKARKAPVERPHPDAAAALDEQRAGWKTFDIAVVVGLMISILAVYGQVGAFEFINYDDNLYVYENPHVQGGLTRDSLAWVWTAVVSNNWMPVTLLSHVLDAQWFGMRSGGHHWMNVLWHLLSTVLLFVTLRRATKAPAASAFVAFVFGLHPLHVQSVAWVAERKDVLSTFFWFAALHAYVRYAEKPNWGWYSAMITAFALGLMSKPMLVTFPFTLLLFDLWPLRRWNWPKVAIEKTPLFVLSAAASVVTYLVQETTGAVAPIPLADRLENAFVSYLTYIAQMFWPSGLAFFYQQPPAIPLWQTVVSLVTVLAVTLAVIRMCSTRSYLTMGWLWYVGTLVPVIGFVQVGGQAHADRYMYVPMIGLLIMLAWGVTEIARKWPQSKTALPVAAAIYCLVCAVLAYGETGYWKNGQALYERAIAVTRYNAVAQNNLGMHWMAMNRPADALPHFEAAVQASPDFAGAHNNLAFALSQFPDRAGEVAQHYETALRLAPGDPEAHNGIGGVLMRSGNCAAATPHFQAALASRPQDVLANYNLGGCHMTAGNHAAAVPYFEAALRARPGFAEARASLASALAKVPGRALEAIKEYEAVLQMAPAEGLARMVHVRLGMLLAEAGRIQEAIAYLEKAQRPQSDPEVAKLLDKVRASTKD